MASFATLSRAERLHVYDAGTGQSGPRLIMKTLRIPWTRNHTFRLMSVISNLNTGALAN